MYIFLYMRHYDETVSKIVLNDLQGLVLMVYFLGNLNAIYLYL